MSDFIDMLSAVLSDRPLEDGNRMAPPPAWYEPFAGMVQEIEALKKQVNELTAEVNQLKQSAQDKTEENFW